MERLQNYELVNNENFVKNQPYCTEIVQQNTASEKSQVQQVNTKSAFMMIQDWKSNPRHPER